jgi:hypothetical protein
MADPPKLLTPSRIAEEVGEPLAKVLRVLTDHPHIRPVATADSSLVFQRADLPLIRAAMNRSSRQKGVRHA